MLLTDAGDDVELVVDLLVHGGGDDADLREGVGHRVHAHLRHQQRQQEDFVLRDVVVLKGEEEGVAAGGAFRREPCGAWTHQQHSDGHESGGSGGDGAVHQDDVVLADVFGETQVVQLEEEEESAEEHSEVGQSVKHSHLRLSGVVVGLDEDLAQPDVLADGHEGLLHGLARPQDGHARDLKPRT